MATNTNDSITITRSQLVSALEQLRGNNDYINERVQGVSSKSRARAWRRAAADVIWMGLTSTEVPTAN